MKAEKIVKKMSIEEKLTNGEKVYDLRMEGKESEADALDKPL